MIIGIEKGNLIESLKFYGCDGILNAANGVGVMGAGIAGAIRKAGGIEVQNDALRVCKKYRPISGDSYYTVPGKLSEFGIKNVVHAVTMSYPGIPSKYENISKAFDSSLKLCESIGITRIGCTALGTGIGGLDPSKVSEKMFPIAHESKVGVFFCDIDERFVKNLKLCWSVYHFDVGGFFK